jgi:hypothetical protein
MARLSPLEDVRLSSHWGTRLRRLRTFGCRLTGGRGCRRLRTFGCRLTGGRGCRRLRTFGCRLTGGRGCRRLRTFGCRLTGGRGCRRLRDHFFGFPQLFPANRWPSVRRSSPTSLREVRAPLLRSDPRVVSARGRQSRPSPWPDFIPALRPRPHRAPTILSRPAHITSSTSRPTSVVQRTIRVEATT